MPRFILIDNASGYIFGDTAMLRPHKFADDDCPLMQSGLTPVDAARWMDETEVGEHGRTYEVVSRHALASNETGYHVYRADVGGSDAFALVLDGQDQEMIAAVERDCRYVTSIRCGSQEPVEPVQTVEPVQIEDVRDLLARLVGWQIATGGWDAAVWRDAEAMLAKLGGDGGA